MIKYICKFRLVLKCLLVEKKKEELDRCFNRLVEESRPEEESRPDRFLSLLQML